MCQRSDGSICSIMKDDSTAQHRLPSDPCANALPFPILAQRVYVQDVRSTTETSTGKYVVPSPYLMIGGKVNSLFYIKLATFLAKPIWQNSMADMKLKLR